MKSVFSLFLIVLLAFLTLSLSGCSSFKMQEVYTMLEAGDPEAAYVYMAEKGPREDSMWADTRNFTKESGFLFERGLVAHYAKRFSASNYAFSQTENTSKGYSGTQFEKLLRHYYQILNFVYQNQWDQALVECRRAMAYTNNATEESGDYMFIGAALLAHLSGMCFEASGEWNEAFYSYQYAEIYYQKAALNTEIRMPVDVGKSLVRLARQLNFANEASHYQRKYGEPDLPTDAMGELILFYESGYVPTTSNQELTFPILKIDIENDTFRENNQKEKAIAQNFVVNSLLPRKGQSYSYKDLEYVLNIDLPERSSNRPQITGVLAQADNRQQTGVLISDIQAMALETYHASSQAVLIQTVTDVFMEYLTYRVDKSKDDQRKQRERARERARAKEREKEKKEEEEREKEIERLRAQLLRADTLEEKNALINEIREIRETQVINEQLDKSTANLEDSLDTFQYGVAKTPKRPSTGDADKRSWKTLPNQIFLVRMPLPEGIHNVTLFFLDNNGQYSKSTILSNVEVSPNRMTFINYRTYK